MAIQSFKIKSFEQRLSVLQLLVENGADINQTDQYQTSPRDLLEKSFHDATPTEIELIQNKILIHDTSNHVPPIYQGIYEKDPDIVQSAIASDELAVNVEYKEKTPIICAAYELVGCVDIILENRNEHDVVQKNLKDLQQLATILQILLSNGGDPELEPKRRKSLNNAVEFDGGKVMKPLHLLVCSLRTLCPNNKASNDHHQLDECYEILQSIILLLTKQGKAAITTDTQQLLYQAARWDELQFVKFLIEELKIDPNTEGPQKMTPLHFAARSGRMNVLVGPIDSHIFRDTLLAALFSHC
jgi:hypothetical protein